MGNKFMTFLGDCLKSLNNKEEGNSLKKELAVGFFALIAGLSIVYTDKTNLIAVLSIFTGMITALVVTNAITKNIKQKDTTPPNPPADEPK